MPTNGTEDGLLRRHLNLAANSLIDRSSLMQSLLGGPRDIDRDCNYPKGVIPRELYQELYDREPVAARVVEVYPKECWQVQPSVYEDEDSETETAFEEAWAGLATSIRAEKSYHQDEQGSVLWEYLYRADVLSGIGHYGIILLGIDDGKDLAQPADLMPGSVSDEVTLAPEGTPWTPLPGTPEAGPIGETGPRLGGRGTGSTGPTAADLNRGARTGGFANGKNRTWSWNQANGDGNGKKGPKRRLTFLRVFPESMAWIDQFDSNPASPRFGQPVRYTLLFNDPAAQAAGVGLQMVTAPVHWTRVIHVADNLASSEVFGVPRQQPVLNRLLDIRKIHGGSAEMYWRGAFPGYALETLPQLGTEVDIDQEGVKKMMWDWANGLQRHVVLTGLTMKSLSPQVTDPSPQVNTQIEAICIKLGVPIRIFKGSERGELASSQDDAAWNDRLKQRQAGYVTPRLIVPFVDRLIALGVLPAPEGYSVWWPDLTSKSDQEKAAIASQRTTGLVAYGNSAPTQDIITPTDYLIKVQGFDEAEAQSVVENAQAEKDKREKEQAKQQADQFKQQQDQADAEHQRQLELAGVQGSQQTPPGAAGDGSGDGGTGGVPPAGPGGSPGGSSVAVPTSNSDGVHNAGAELTGGQWLTIEGVHVYVKDGKIVAGPAALVGHPPSDLKSIRRDAHRSETRAEAATHKATTGGSRGDHVEAMRHHADAAHLHTLAARHPDNKAPEESKARAEAASVKATRHADEAGHGGNVKQLEAVAASGVYKPGSGRALTSVSPRYREEVLDSARRLGLHPAEVSRRVSEEVDRNLAARDTSPHLFSHASHEDTVRSSVSRTFEKMLAEVREKEVSDFKSLREEVLAKPVPPPKELGPSAARVEVLSRRPVEAVEERVKKLLGSKATLQDVASLTGAPHDATVTITPGREAGTLTARVRHEDYVSRRTIYRDDDGKLVVHNDEFFMKPGAQGKGLGAEVFTRQVENAQKLGVDRIETHAAGRPYNGYYTWPRFGYDQPLWSVQFYAPHLATPIKEKFPGAESVGDLMLTHEGRSWWKEHGTGMFNAVFDLKPGSRSLKVLHAYHAERASRQATTHNIAAHMHHPEEVDDIGNGQENFDHDQGTIDALDAAWDKLHSGDTTHNYDPDQPRDDTGKWASSGGGGSDVIQTAEFKEWFGKSKVVDADGKPRLLYRGSGAESAAQHGGADSGNMIFLSTEKDLPARYAAQYQGGKVRAFYVRAEDPIDISRDGYQLWKDYKAETGAPGYASGSTREGMAVAWTHESEFRKWLDTKGIKYDGIYFAENDRSRSLAVRNIGQLWEVGGNQPLGNSAPVVSTHHPHQPRVPAGTPGAGQFAKDDGGSGKSGDTTSPDLEGPRHLVHSYIRESGPVTASELGHRFVEAGHSPDHGSAISLVHDLHAAGHLKRSVDDLGLETYNVARPTTDQTTPEGDREPLRNAAKVGLTGGRWVTIEGVHVYVKGGKIVAGPAAMEGRSPSDLKSILQKHSTASVEEPAATPPAREINKTGPATPISSSQLKSMEPDLSLVKDAGRRDSLAKSVKAYYDGDFTEMNTALREGRAPHSRLKDTIDTFRSAFGEVGHELQKDVTVYRVVKKMPFDVASLGATFHDKGFVSTTADKSVANGIGIGGDTSERKIFSIRLPRGMKVIAGMGGRDQAKEVTLPDGVKFKVVSVGKKTLLGQHVGLEVVRA